MSEEVTKKVSWGAKLSAETVDKLEEIAKDWPDAEAAMAAMVTAYSKQTAAIADPERAKMQARVDELKSAIETLAMTAYDDKSKSLAALKAAYEGEDGKLTAAQKLNEMLQQQLADALTAKAATEKGCAEAIAAAEAERDRAKAEAEAAIKARDEAIAAKEAAEAHARDIDDLRALVSALAPKDTKDTSEAPSN